MKKYSEKPYYATQKNVVQVITDYDELPYRRWYRGFPESDVPIAAVNAPPKPNRMAAGAISQANPRPKPPLP